MSTPEKVLVVGASGTVGRGVVDAFLQDGVAVRAMARHRDGLSRAFGDRAELVAGDATSPADVERAVDGCTDVHVCLAHGSDEAPAVEVIVRAAARAGLRRLSYISGTSVCERNAWFPLVADKLRAESMLQAGKVPWTIFRPTWVMEVLDNFFKHGRAVCFGRGEFPLHFLAAADLGSAIARAHAIPDAENRAFRLLGPEPVRLIDAIDRVRAALHPSIPSVSHLPFLVARIVGRLGGRSFDQMADGSAFVHYFEGIDEGEADPDATRLLGPCSTTLQAWLDERRRASGAESALTA